jgi:uncharacterized protein
MRRRTFLKGLLGTGLAGLLFAGYGLVIEPWWRLRVVTWALQPDGWPRGRKMRIVMISDLHAMSPQMRPVRIAAIAAKAQSLNADLICLMGDYRATHKFQRGFVPIEMTAPILATLRAPLGVHAILGNHDWRDDPEAVARRAAPVQTQLVMEAAGIPVLHNRAVRIDAPEGAFWLAGLGSLAAFSQRMTKDMQGAEDIPGTLAQITDDAPVIMMAHEPDLFVRLPPRVTLTLSGHTHGGQINLFGWTPGVASAYGQRFRYGPILEDGRNLVVSGGLGCSLLPIRINSPPEITVVDLS